MPLWLIRVVLSLLAAFLLAQAAGYLVSTGKLGSLVSAIQPENPRRQLERSISAVIDRGRVDAVVIGRAPFVNTVISACDLGQRVVPVVVDNPRWRDYWDILRNVDRLRPSVFVFQGRPYLWTDMQYSWPTQQTNLMARWGKPGWFPLDDVRTVFATLGEMARGRPGGQISASATYDLTGARYDLSDGDRFLPRISDRLSRRPHDPVARFVLDETWLLDSALPQTRDDISAAFERSSGHANIEFLTAARFATEMGCRTETLGQPPAPTTQD